jgi:hypothetical protein
MPHEIRQIFFSADEVVQALADYRPSEALGLNSKHTKITLRRNGQPKICVGLGEATIGEFGLALVSAALLQFCRHHGIPIPKDADKAISMFGDGLAVTITIGSLDRIDFKVPGDEPLESSSDTYVEI